jgi:bidirectional [NiFe] hydrogenase diaphorase subunit
MTPEEVCKEIIASGLRGRGGAGFPTGLKWDMVRKEHADKKYVVANGDEGDPGAYMDRSLMESDPHRILEGMAIAGYAVGADQGFLYVRGEYAVAAKRLERAIRAANAAVCWAAACWTAASTFASTCASARAPLSAAKRRR